MDSYEPDDAFVRTNIEFKDFFAIASVEDDSQRTLGLINTVGHDQDMLNTLSTLAAAQSSGKGVSEESAERLILGNSISLGDSHGGQQVEKRTVAGKTSDGTNGAEVSAHKSVSGKAGVETSLPPQNVPLAAKRKKDSVNGGARSRLRTDAAATTAGGERGGGFILKSPAGSHQSLAQTQLCLSQNPSLATRAPDVSLPSLNLLDKDGQQSENAIEGFENALVERNWPIDPAARRAQVRAWGNQPLAVVDPDLWEIMEREKVRQYRGIELIASENFASLAVFEALGSHLTNKYSEGLPGSRYYGGNEHIDMIETLCCSRALTAFRLDPKEWGVNVQPYSCTSANFAVYTALLQPRDRIMGLDVPSGGHVSHGYYTASGKKVSGASIFFESLPFKVNPRNGLIDFDTLEKFAMTYRPKILICGGSAYPREWDYARFREIANRCGAVLMCDMAHISGLIAAQEVANPFDHCDIVTSTTHKSLRGPRGGIIFYRKGVRGRRGNGPDYFYYDFEDRINFAVHPSLQGGPHNNHIAALAVALKQVATPEYQNYIRQVKKNAQALASALVKRGCVLVTGGTDNHLLLWDVRNRGLTGNRLEKVCEMCHMTVNKNAVFGDSNALGVGGVRIGTPAMTSRGCIEADFEVIADLLMKAVQIAENIQKEHGKLQEDYLKGLHHNQEIPRLRERVEKFASMFQMPGFDVPPACGKLKQ